MPLGRGTDLAIIWTIIGVGIAIVGLIYTFLRNVKTDIKSDMQTRDKLLGQLDARIFQLAMGKTLKEILLEEKTEEKKE